MIAPTTVCQPLYEQYRPATWEDVVGQDKAVERLLFIKGRGGFGGRAFWISGQSGTGKTTIGKLIANEVAEPICIHEYDAGMLNLDQMQKIETTSRSIGMGEERKGRAIIVNEAHGLSKRTIRQLLVALERIPPHVTWIFTTTLEGESLLFEDSEDVNPLLSRCIRLQLTRQGLAEVFADRLFKVATLERLCGPEATVKNALSLIKKHRNNFRAAMQDVEAGALL